MAGFKYRPYFEGRNDIGTFDIVSDFGDGEFSGAFVVVQVELAEPRSNWTCVLPKLSHNQQAVELPGS